MSGGSLEYVCYAEPEDMLYQSKIDSLEYAEKELISKGYEDIAQDVRRLIEYCLTARNRITVLKDQLADVLHAIEWEIDGDYSENTLKEHLEKYRNK